MGRDISRGKLVESRVLCAISQFLSSEITEFLRHVTAAESVVMECERYLTFFIRNSTSSLTLSSEAGENRLISSFKSFCSFRNFFISSTSLQTGSGTASFLHALGPVFLTVSDLMPPRVMVSSLAATVLLLGAAAVETGAAPKRLVAGVALVVLPKRLLGLPRFRVVPPPPVAGAAGVVRDVLPKREGVVVVVEVVVVAAAPGLEALRLPNSPPVELEAELVADGLTPKRVPAVGVLVVALPNRDGVEEVVAFVPNKLVVEAGAAVEADVPKAKPIFPQI